MTKEQILAKLKELNADEALVGAIDELDNSSEIDSLKSQLEAEQGKTAGILADKRKYKERAETAEGELKKINDAKLPEEERHKKELTELKEKLDAEKLERENDKAEFAKTQREAKLADLTGAIRWAEGTPHETAKLIVSRALKDVDLSDQTKVDEVLKTVKESHKTFIAAAAPGGTGGKGDKGGGGGDENKVPSIADNQKELWGEK